MGGCKENLHAQCCHRPAITATFTAKVTVQPMAQRKWRWQTTRDTPKEIGVQSQYNETDPI